MACALLDVKRLAAEIVAECRYVWRNFDDTENEYMGAYPGDFTHALEVVACKKRVLPLEKNCVLLLHDL